MASRTFFSAIGDVVLPFKEPTSSAPGEIDNMTIGPTTPAVGSFTALASSGPTSTASLQIDTGTKTASATSGAATLDKNSGVITSEDLTTAAGADYTLTLTNSTIAAASQVFASTALGTSTAGEPVVTSVTPAAGSVVIKIRNIDSTNEFNGTITIAFMNLKN